MTTVDESVSHSPGLDACEGCVVALVGVVRPHSVEDVALRRGMCVEGSRRAVVSLAVREDATIGHAIGEWVGGRGRRHITSVDMAHIVTMGGEDDRVFTIVVFDPIPSDAQAGDVVEPTLKLTAYEETMDAT